MPARGRGRTVAFTLLAVLVVAACADGGTATSATGSRSGGESPSGPVASERTTRSPTSLTTPTQAALEASFARLAADLDGSVGVVWAPLTDPSDQTVLGSLQTAPAWSTSKVAVAVAALADPTESTADNVRAALQVSDNVAARALWDQLGGDTAPAAAAVDGVLAAHGDLLTHTPILSPRTEYSPYGMTEWSLVQQVHFVAGLFCSTTSIDRVVVGHLGEVTTGQRWGLGRIDGASFKGGWGPGTDGVYLARQMGMVTLDGTPTVIAVAARARNGSFEGATAALDEIAQWLTENVPAGRTSSGTARC